MARNYTRRYSANHKETMDRLLFQPLPKGITLSCMLFEDGGCSGPAAWTIATEMGAPVILCTNHADKVTAVLISKGHRFQREPIPTE